MKKCQCGCTIAWCERYCERCKNNLSLKEKVIEELKHDKIFGSSNHGKARSKE